MSLDYNAIHKHLKQLKLAQNGAAGSTDASDPTAGQLDEQTAIRYLSLLRQDIIQQILSQSEQQQMSSRTLNEIIIFTKTLDFVPKSDSLFAIFDSKLFSSLFEALCFPEIPVEALRGILRICLTYLAGVIPKTRKQGMFSVLLAVLCEKVDLDNRDSNIKHSKTLRCDLIFANLTTRITFADARMNLNIVDFIAKVLYRLMETIGSSSHQSKTLVLEEQWLLSVIRSLYVTNFFGVLAGIKGIDEIEGMTGLRGSMSLTYQWLKNKSIDESNSVWIECYELTKEVGVIFKEDENNIQILSVLSLVGALGQPKRSLKKILVECNMTSSIPILEFTVAIGDFIAQNAPLEKIFGIWNTDLWFSLLNVSTRCWLASNAKIDSGDTSKIINLLKVVIEWLSNQLERGSGADSSFSFTQTKLELDASALLEKIDNFEYQELKKLQLEMLNKTRNLNWASEMKSFENLVHSQVIDLVRDQRFLQLSKGSWVYATNPLEQGAKRHFFLTLNSNSQSIVYKEFSKRPAKSSQAPNLDKDGIYIDFRNIVNVQAETLNNNIDDTGLISIQSDRLDVNRVDIATKTGLFSFYVDTKQLKDIWVDGLRILIADSCSDAKDSSLVESKTMVLSLSEQFFAKSDVSATVRDQIKTLEDIRLRTQMLDLHEKVANNASNVSSINDGIDWKNLSVNFYYQ